MSNPLPKKPSKVPIREKTAREKALEFARNVPKPKNLVKRTDSVSNADRADQNRRDSHNGMNEDIQQVDEEYYDSSHGMGGTGTGDPGESEPSHEINQLAEKHDAYADELEKIKQMLM